VKTPPTAPVPTAAAVAVAVAVAVASILKSMRLNTKSLAGEVVRMNSVTAWPLPHTSG